LNHAVVSGELVEVSTLRHTPAGLAVLEIRLAHSEMVEQSGISRSIQFEITVFAFGDLALMWQTARLGQALVVEGFLAAARKNSPRLVLHAKQIGVSSNN
jgi:primosomal replication protein N